MTFKGERFNIDMPDVEEDTDSQGGDTSLFSGFVKDISERNAPRATSVVAPKLRKGSDGFPKSKKRTSKFKSGQIALQNPTVALDDPNDHRTMNTAAKDATLGTNDSNKADASFLGRNGLDHSEQESIDRENRQKLATMSSESIEQEKQDLLENLSPGLIKKLLNGSEPADSAAAKANDLGRKIPATVEAYASENIIYDSETAGLNEGHQTQAENLDRVHEAIPHIHFPKPRDPPSLDPAAPSFLEDLHAKYFPSLPSDPSKLAWMSSSTPAKTPYNLDEIPVAALRFAFDGTLLAPRTAKEIPVTAGLHHHGDDPDTAGYTIAELSHLARSTFPAQRCIAYQTLGRLLYRLGIGEFGASDSVIPLGLWNCVEQGKVINSLQEESGKAGGHVSAKAYATEALWLWQKGGGSRWTAQ
ncbi:MAG: hypothetical protein M1831_005259 [Alyxoria varia]|nr:MAG: hypothetical protein M1831_005259 [Alyxoria varia]